MAKTNPAALAAALNEGLERFTSESFQERIGAFDMSNLANIGQTILNYEPLVIEFTNMISKIVQIWIRQKGLVNPLALLKRAVPSPLGLDIEEVFANPAEEKDFDPCGSTLLACAQNDIKVAYHRRSRETQYTAWVSRAQMQAAFTSWDKMDALIQQIVNTLFNGNVNSEWEYSKALFGQAATDNLIKNITTVNPIDASTGATFVKACRQHALNLQMPGSNYNSYMTLPGAIGDPVICQTMPEDLILIIRSDALTNIDVDVLAKAFNMTNTDFMGRVLKVDTFTNADGTPNPKQLAFLGDQNVPVVITQLEETSTFWNAQALKWTYFLSMFQIWSISPFWNGVMFMAPPDPSEP